MIRISALLLLLISPAWAAEKPFYSAELLFAPEDWHNHSSSIVELPNGDLFVSWFHGSGERTADDVLIEGARWRKSSGTWSARFVLADTPGFPDTNCVTYVDSQRRLWLLWPVILANQWETALMKYRISTDYMQPEGPPNWQFSDNILLIPKNIEARTVAVFGGRTDVASLRQIEHAKDKYFSRLGWFTRTHPLDLPGGRMLVPMYSDGFPYGIMAITDDGGRTWRASDPIVGFGGIQPSVVRKASGELVAYLRDNGPPPKRVQRSVSEDNGETWTTATDTDIPNPGSSIEVIRLASGRWVMVGNDTERNRNSLRIAMSDDEGSSWKWQRHLEFDPRGLNSYHYPSVRQSADGAIQVTYSYFVRDNAGEKQKKSIKHARFNAAWIEEGDAR